jgi:hypothetical protein
VAFRGGCNPAPAKARDAARIRPRTLQGAHLIEDFSCKLNQFRAIATRYDKPPEISLLPFTSPRLFLAQLTTDPSVFVLM